MFIINPRSFLSLSNLLCGLIHKYFVQLNRLICFLYFQRLLIFLDLCALFLCYTGVANFEAVLLFSFCLVLSSVFGWAMMSYYGPAWGWKKRHMKQIRECLNPWGQSFSNYTFFLFYFISVRFEGCTLWLWPPLASW